MGYDAYAYACIGLPIDSNKLYTEKEIRECNHSVKDKRAKFCPTCGKPTALKKVRVPIVAYAGQDESFEKLCGFDLIRTSSMKREPGFIAGLIVKTYYDKKVAGIDIASSKVQALHDSMKASLEPLGLWNEKAFGLYAILYESC